MGKPGRPTLYSPEMADRICEELMLGRSLRAICEEDDWSPGFRTVIGWLAQDVPGFRAKYAAAREVQADVHADDIVYIADRTELGEIETDKFDKDGNPITEVRRADMIEHRKLRITTRQWTAEKLRPKAYGTKQFVEHSGGIALGAMDDEELVAGILELVATGRFKLPNGLELAEGDQDDDAEEEDDFSDIA